MVKKLDPEPGESAEYGISVWNCQIVGIINRKNHAVVKSEFTEEEEKLLAECIESSGGAINLSGIYPITVDLLEKLGIGTENKNKKEG